MKIVIASLMVSFFFLIVSIFNRFVLVSAVAESELENLENHIVTLAKEKVC
jgi:hypothetical protein